MNTYKAFYKSQTIEVQANTSYEAQTKAAEQLKVKPKNSYQVTVMIVAKDGVQVTHKTADLD